MGLVNRGDLLPAPPRRIPALTAHAQRVKALGILLQNTRAPGLERLSAALDDALRIAEGQACRTHHVVRLPRRGDTTMRCERCRWSRPMTDEDVTRDLATLQRHLDRASA